MASDAGIIDPPDGTIFLSRPVMNESMSEKVTSRRQRTRKRKAEAGGMPQAGANRAPGGTHENPAWQPGSEPSPAGRFGEAPLPAGVLRDPLSFHARIMAELKALGGVACPGPAAGSEPDGADDDGGGREQDSGDGLESAGGLHHLHYDRAKGWLLRVTVDLGKQVIGKRLKFHLRTRDAGEAEKARDLILATLRKLGLTVRLRMQGKRG